MMMNYQRLYDEFQYQVTDFQIMNVLGEGEQGKVYLVQNQIDRQYYAMKVERKDRLIKYEGVQAALEELNIMREVDHPFLLGLSFFFQTNYKLYFIMPFIRGGELFEVLLKAEKFRL